MHVHDLLTSGILKLFLTAADKVTFLGIRNCIILWNRDFWTRWENLHRENWNMDRISRTIRTLFYKPEINLWWWKRYCSKNHNSTLFFKGLISVSIDVLSASSSYKATYSEVAGYITISSIPEAVLVVKQRVSTSIRMKLASMYK